MEGFTTQNALHGFWGSAQAPDGGAYSAPPCPLAGREGCPPPAPSPGAASPARPPLLGNTTGPLFDGPPLIGALASNQTQRYLILFIRPFLGIHAHALYTLPWSQVSDRQPPVNPKWPLPASWAIDPMTAKDPIGMIAASDDYSILAFHTRGRDLQGQAIVLHAWGQHGLTHSSIYLPMWCQNLILPSMEPVLLCEPGGVLDGPSAFGW